MRAVVARCILPIALALAAAAKGGDSYELLELLDGTLEPALKEHKLMLLSIGVADNCEPCRAIERKMRAAGKELRVKAPSVVLAKLTIMSQDSPVIANIVQGQLTLPKLLIFRDGEAMDFDAEVTKAGIVAEMLRQVSRESILTLKSVKQAERFLHLDSWSVQHADEEQPPRVVGFFPSNSTAGYAVFASVASKLQGMVAFGECFDPTLQKKFLGAPATRSTIHIVKADKRERKLAYAGALAVPSMARWVATHSLSLVQDLTSESSIEAHMARGVPVFLLLMPDEYEESLSTTMDHFRAVARSVRERLLFAYGFKDTEPWPQFAQALGIDRGATGAFWMIVGNGMELTGRNWSTAWLKPPSLGFQIYAMEARGGEKAHHVTEKKLSSFVQGFLAQVDEAMPPEVVHAVVEEDVEPAGVAEQGAAAPAGAGKGKDAAAEYDRDLRKLISALEMSFNSGVANLKKSLDDTKDAPHLLAGKAPTIISALTSTENKVKKGMLDLKRKLMDIGKRKDEL